MSLRVKQERDDSKPEVKPFSLSFVTWNYNKGTKGGKFADIRNTIVPLMFSQVKETAFICHQEVTVKDDTARSKFFKNPGKYFYMSRKESSKKNSTRQAISFLFKLKEKYSVEYCRVNSDKATIGRYYSQLITVTRREYEVCFVLVSYHAPHRVKKQNKIKILKEFLDKMCDIADKEETPVIVGGDFNLDVDEWRKSIMHEFKSRVFVAPIYDGIPDQPHSTKIIDTFLVVHPKETQYIVKLHTPVPICSIPKDNYFGGNETKIVRVDHYKVLHYSDDDYDKIKRVTQNSYKKDHRDWKSILNKLLDHDLVMINIDISFLL